MISQINNSIVLFLNEWAVSSLYATNTVVFLAVYLGWFILALVLLYSFKSGRSRRKMFRIYIWSLLCACGALLMTDLIKTWQPISRPDSALEGIRPLFSPLGKASFPSSHASFFGGFAWAYFKQNRRVGIFAIIAVIIMSVSRVVAGIHYPLDIVAGFFMAFISYSILNLLKGLKK